MSDGTSNGNGARSAMKAAGDERAKRCVELVLTFDPITCSLEIGGEVVNYDMARAILAQADRWFEAQQRAANAIELQRKIQEAAQAQAIADSLRGRH